MSKRAWLYGALGAALALPMAAAAADPLVDSFTEAASAASSGSETVRVSSGWFDREGEAEQDCQHRIDNAVAAIKRRLASHDRRDHGVHHLP
jgi:hypothetical protein